MAIVAADTLLGIQDFRADEKAFHTMEQFRGRCGRRGKKGRLIIQTSQPEHPIYRKLTNHECTSERDMLTERQDFGFPPYTRIIELTLKDIYEDRVERMADLLAQRIKHKISSDTTGCLLQADPVSSPYRPVVDRIADQHIRKIRICLKKDRQLASNKTALKEIICLFEKEKKYDGHITIDVDPS